MPTDDPTARRLAEACEKADTHDSQTRRLCDKVTGSPRVHLEGAATICDRCNTLVAALEAARRAGEDAVHEAWEKDGGKLERDEYERGRAECAAELAGTQHDLKKAMRDYTHASGQRNDAEAALAVAQQKIERLQADNHKMRDEWNSMFSGEYHLSTVRTLKAEIATQQQEIAALKAELNRCDPLDASHIRYIEHEAALAKAQQEIAALKDIIKSLEAERAAK